MTLKPCFISSNNPQLNVKPLGLKLGWLRQFGGNPQTPRINTKKIRIFWEKLDYNLQGRCPVKWGNRTHPNYLFLDREILSKILLMPNDSK